MAEDVTKIISESTLRAFMSLITGELKTKSDIGHTHELGELSNVDINGLNDKDTIYWDEETQKWVTGEIGNIKNSSFNEYTSSQVETLWGSILGDSTISYPSLDGYATIRMLEEYAKKNHSHNVNDIADIADYYYSKEQVDQRIANIITGGEMDLSNYALKTDLHFHENKAVLDTITQEDIDRWDSGSNKHTHVISDVLGLQEKLDSKADIEQLHSHDNLDVLNSITSDKILSWDNKTDFTGNYNDLLNIPTEFTPKSHTHSISDVENLQSTLDTKVTQMDINNAIDDVENTILNIDSKLSTIENTVADNTEAIINKANVNHTHSELHTHDNKETLDNITDEKIAEWNNKSDFSGSFNDLTDIPYTFEPSDHTHEISEVNNLQTSLNSKANVNHTHSELHTHENSEVLDGITSEKVDEWNNKSNFSGNYADLTNVPTEFNPKGHNHSIEDVTGLQDSLDGKAESNHTHEELHTHDNKETLDTITNEKIAEWNNKSNFSGNYADLNNIPNEFTPSSHNHTVTDVPDISTYYYDKTEIDQKIANMATGGEIDLSGYAKKTDLHEHTNKETLDSITSEKIVEWDAKSNFSGDYADLTNVPTEFNPSKHNHLISEVTGLQTSLDDKASKNHTHEGLHTHDNKETLDKLTETKMLEWDNKSNFSGNYNDLIDKPTAFEPIAHTHDVSEIENMDIDYYKKDEVDSAISTAIETNKQDLSDYALKSELHSHTNKDILDGIDNTKINEWDNKSNFSGNYSDLTNIPTEFNPSTHSHVSSEITDLQEKLDAKSDKNHTHEGLHTHDNKDVLDKITNTKVSSWDNKSDFSGDYADLTNIPTNFTPSSHNHSIDDVTNLRASLDSKAESTHTHDELHTHDNKDVLDTLTSDKIAEWDAKSGFDGNYENLTNVPETFTPSSHTHKMSEVAGLQTSLDSKASVEHTHDELHTHTNKEVLDGITSTKINEWDNKSTFSGNYNDLSNIPSKFSPETHTHTISEVDNLQTSLDSKSDKNHTHTELHSHTNKTVLDGITSAKISEWNSKSTFSGNYNDLSNIPTKFNPSEHNHTISEITGLETELATKAYADHTHNELHTHDNKNIIDSITADDIANWNDKTPNTHNHTISEIAGLENELSNKADISQVHEHSNKSVLDTITSEGVDNWNNKETITGSQEKANIALNEAKSYTDSQISSLIGSAPETLNTLEELAEAINSHESAYGSLLETIGGKADIGHTHKISDVTNLQSTLDSKYNINGGTISGDVTLQKVNNGRTDIIKNHSESVDYGTYVKDVKSDGESLAIVIQAGQGSPYIIDNAGNTAYLLNKNNAYYEMGLSVTANELNYVKGATSSIQTQLNNKANSSHTHTIANVTNLQSTLDNKVNKSGATMTGGLYGYIPSTASTMVGNEYNILLHSGKTGRYTFTQSGTGTGGVSPTLLTNGELSPAYSTDGIDPDDPYVLLIEGLPDVHTQTGGVFGWTARYWYPRRYKVEGYNSYNNAGWTTWVDQSTQAKDTKELLYALSPNGKSGSYTKIRITIYESADGSTGANGFPRWGLSEIFFIHPEAVKVYAYADVDMVDGKHASDFAPASHTHTIANITNLQSTLDGKANTSHTHNYAGSSSAGGSANSAVKLSTARTLTIGKTGKTFDGSANVSWDMNEILGKATTNSTATTNKNKYVKFARIDISGGAWSPCIGKFSIDSAEANVIHGILSYYFRTGATIESQSITLKWTSLNNSVYADKVKAVKVSNGIFDLYFNPLNDYETTVITNLSCSNPEKITMYSGQGYVDTITAVATSTLESVSSNATKLLSARTLTIGNTGKTFDGTANVSWSLSEIGALPLTGGTVSNSSFGALNIERSGSTNGASIGFKNSSGTLGYIGMTSSANGGLLRYTADTNTSYTVLDTGNFKTHVTPASIGASSSSHTHNYAGSSSAGGVANSANKIEVADTRSTNPLPAEMFSGRGVNFEFKQPATIGITDESTYAGVMQMRQWDNDSGGKATQMAFPDSGNIYVRKGNVANGWGSWERLAYTKDIDKNEPLVLGTHTTKTNVWTGNVPFTSLQHGQKILYWLPYDANGSNVTLELTYPNGTTTGAIACYWKSTTRLTTHLGRGCAIRMVYLVDANINGTNYTGWWTDASYDSGNTYDRFRYTQVIKCGTTAIASGNIIVGKDGVYEHLKLGNSFDITYPILYAVSNISASATGTNNYVSIPFTITTTQSITLTQYLPVYIKGTLSGKLFTPVSTAPLTQTVPTAHDNYHYMLLGTAYSTTAVYLLAEHPIFKYDGTKFSLYNNQTEQRIIDANFQTQFRTQTKGDTNQGGYITPIRTNTADVSGAPRHGAGLSWGVDDVHGYIGTNYSTGQVFIGGGNLDKLNWVKEVAFKDSNVASATKLATARTLTIGNTGKTFDGTANVSWTASEMGVIPLTGAIETVTGNIEFSNTGATSGTTRGIGGKIADNDYWRVVGGQTASNAGYLEIATADDGSEPIYVRQYNSGKFGNVVRTATLLDGSGNTSFPNTVSASRFIGAFGESYLTWGGKSISGGISPVGASLSSEHSANRLAYLNANAIAIEYSNDGGSTWTDSGISNSTKIGFVTTSGVFSVGSNSTVTTNHRTRVTLTAQNGTNSYVYTNPRKLLFNVSTAGHGLSVTIERKTGASGASWVTVGTYPLSGWSGWNDIAFDIGTFGGGKTQTGNNWYIRMTFATTSVNSSYPTTKSSIISMRMFGDNCWTRTSNMGETGHLYSYDTGQNATFPAQVTATGNIVVKGDYVGHNIIDSSGKSLGGLKCNGSSGRLEIGSSSASGDIRIYNSRGKSIYLQTNASLETDAILTLPAKSGTLATLDDCKQDIISMFSKDSSGNPTVKVGSTLYPMHHSGNMGNPNILIISKLESAPYEKGTNFDYYWQNSNVQNGYFEFTHGLTQNCVQVDGVEGESYLQQRVSKGTEWNFDLGKTYTFSGEYYAPSLTINSGGYARFRMFDDSANSGAGANVKTFNITQDSSDGWKKFSLTYTMPAEDGNYYNDFSCLFVGIELKNCDGYVFVRRFKLEEGTIATKWVPNPSYDFFGLGEGCITYDGGFMSGNMQPFDYGGVGKIGSDRLPYLSVNAKFINAINPTAKEYVARMYSSVEGTTSKTGEAVLELGNSYSSAKAGNAKGIMKLFGSNMGYTSIVSGNTSTTNYTITIPAKTGTVAITEDGYIKMGDTVSGYLYGTVSNSHLGSLANPFTTMNAKNFKVIDNTNSEEALRMFIDTVGTTSTVGKAVAHIGNSMASGSAGNYAGELWIAGSRGGYVKLKTDKADDSVKTLTLPNKTGTIALTSDMDAKVTNDGGISKIKKMTQAQYNALVTKDTSTLYIIVG